MTKLKANSLIGLLSIALFFALGSSSIPTQTVEDSTTFIDKYRDFPSLGSSRDEIHDRSHLIEKSFINNPTEGLLPQTMPTKAIGQHYSIVSQFASDSNPMKPTSDPLSLESNAEASPTMTTQSPVELLSKDELLVKWDSSTAHAIYPPYGGDDQVIWEATAEVFGATLDYTDEIFSEAYFDGATAAVIPMFNRGTLITQAEALAVKNFVDAGGRVLLCGYYDKQYWNYFSENGTNLIAEQFGVSFAVPEGPPDENRWAEVLDPDNNYGQDYELRITNFEPHPLTAGVMEWYLKAPSLVVTNPDVTILARGSPSASYYTEATGWLYGADNIFLAMLENENGGGIIFSAGAYILRNDYTAQHGRDHGYDGTQIVKNVATWLTRFQPPLAKWDSSTAHDIYPPYGGMDQAIWESTVENFGATFGATLEYTDEIFSEAYFDGAAAAVIPMFNRGTLISQAEALAVKNFVDAGGRVLLCGYYDKQYWNYFSENGTNLIAEQFGVSFAVPEGPPDENRWAEVLDPDSNYGQDYELRITSFESHPLTAGVTEWYLKAPSLVVTNPDVTILARGSPSASYYTEATGWLYGADNIFLAMLENENGGGIIFSAGAYILRNDYTAQHGRDHGYDGTQIVENVMTWLVDYHKQTVWIDEAHTISDDIVIRDGESLTLVHSSMTLAGTEGTPESWSYSSFAPYETQFFYFERQPGQSVRVSISWDNGMELDMMDAGIYSALDYPDYPPFYDVPPDLTNWALATGGGSPETTVFRIPEDKGTLFFVALFNYAGVDNSGWVDVTDVQCPSIYVESGGTLKVLEGSHMSVSDPALLGMGILLIQDGGMATFADSSLTDFTTLQIEASDVIVRNIVFGGPGYYNLVEILGASPLIEDSSFWGARSGIYIENADGVIIQNNFITDCNRNGIEVWSSSQCTLANNYIGQIALHGIYLRWTENCWVENNAIYDVGLAGIYLSASSYCTLIDNAMGNAGGILMNGEHAAHGTHFMVGNTLAGQEILYLRDLEGGIISGTYGQVILANVTGVTVTGLTLTAGGNIQFGNATDCIAHSNFIMDTRTFGLLLWDTDHVISSANDIAGSSPWIGIWMRYSRNGLISDSTIANFGLNAIRLESSQDCMVSSNTVSDIGDLGIYVFDCSGGSIVGNAVMNSHMGIVLSSSENIIVSENVVHDNWSEGIALWSSNLNSISANELYSNFEVGIELSDSHANVLSNNQVYWNGWAGITLGYSEENWIVSNHIYENSGAGIDIGICHANVLSENQIFGNGWLGIVLGDSGGHTITDNHVYQNGDHGIALWSSYENIVSGNQVFENGWSGIELGDSGSNTVTDNSIYQNGDAGINSWNSHENIISDNQISGHSWTAIGLGESGSNTITDNCLYENGGCGIDLWMASHMNTISDNRIYQNGWDGLWLGESCENSITDNHIYQNIEDGIQFWNSHMNTISRNRVYENEGVGIWLEESCENALSCNTVFNNWYGILIGLSQGNTISGTYSYSNERDGVQLYFSNDNTITNNRFAQNNRWGIILYNSYYSSVSKNKVYGNSWAGVKLLESGDSNMIIANCIYENGEAGIELEFSSGNEISRNRVYENVGVGIWLAWSDHNQLSCNKIFKNGAQGIWIGNCGFNTLKSNLVYRNAPDSGINLHSSHDHIISWNVICNNEGHGILLEMSESNEISCNILPSNGWIGIFLNDFGEGMGSNGNTISGNIISNTGEDGIFLLASHNNLISHNIVRNAGQYGDLTSGIRLELSNENAICNNWVSQSWIDGIALFSSENNVVTSNTVTNSIIGDGIFLIDSTNNMIASNFLANNAYIGLQLWTSPSNTLTDNILANNLYGIAIAFSDGNTISGSDSYGNVRDGIQLYASHGNTVTENNCADNTRWGIALGYAKGNWVYDNVVAHSSAYGLYLLGSNYNNIQWNSFVQNNLGGTSQGFDDGISNTIEDNYWDDWTSPDTDGDGIVDIPYAIDGTAGNSDPRPRTMP